MKKIIFGLLLFASSVFAEDVEKIKDKDFILVKSDAYICIYDKQDSYNIISFDYVILIEIFCFDPTDEGFKKGVKKYLLPLKDVLERYDN